MPEPRGDYHGPPITARHMVTMRRVQDGLCIQAPIRVMDGTLHVTIVQPWEVPDGWWRGWAGVRPNRLVAPRYTEAQYRLRMARTALATIRRSLRGLARVLVTGDSSDLW